MPATSPLPAAGGDVAGRGAGSATAIATVGGGATVVSGARTTASSLPLDGSGVTGASSVGGSTGFASACGSPARASAMAAKSTGGTGAACATVSAACAAGASSSPSNAPDASPAGAARPESGSGRSGRETAGSDATWGKAFSSQAHGSAEVIASAGPWPSMSYYLDISVCYENYRAPPRPTSPASLAAQAARTADAGSGKPRIAPQEPALYV
jgi:hypothetical protein